MRKIVKIDEQGYWLEDVIDMPIPTEEVERTRTREVTQHDEDGNEVGTTEVEETYTVSEPVKYFETYEKEENGEGEVVWEKVERFVTVRPPNGRFTHKWDFDNKEWTEGKPQEEIDTIRQRQQQEQAEREAKQQRMDGLPSEVDLIGTQAVQLRLKNAQLENLNGALGQQIVQQKLKTNALERELEALRGEQDV